MHNNPVSRITVLIYVVNIVWFYDIITGIKF